MGVLTINSKKHGPQSVFFDDHDHNLIMSQNSWILHKRKNTFYAYCQLNIRKGERFKIYMHRLIMNFPDNKDIDHRDGNGLNNRRSNLREAGRSQNIANQKRTYTNQTGFKGVHFEKRNNSYFALLMVNRKRKVKVGFKSPIEAAKKYNELATLHFGEFAKLNVI